MPNLYDDGAGEASEARPPADGDPGDEAKASTGLLPKSLFGGRDLKPGDKCDIEIVSVHEDEYEVKHPEDGESEQPAEQPAEAPAPDGGGQMSSMLE